MTSKVIIHTIHMAIPLPNFLVYIAFDNGACKIFDIKQLFSHKTLGIKFSRLKNRKGLADKVKVDDGGYGLVWDDDINLGCDDLYFSSRTIENVKTNSGNRSTTTPKTTRTKKVPTPA